MNEENAFLSDTLLMVRPARFGFNDETSGSNIFQKTHLPDKNPHEKAIKEFDSLVKKLREQKIYVIVLQDRNEQAPDSLFPNNWISFHDDRLILYPMLAENRRKERKREWIQLLKQATGTKSITDLSQSENEGAFLEGTGSLVLDRKNKIAYANLSARTDKTLLVRWCSAMGYELISFRASTRDGKEIYHTNVIMSIGDKVAVICTDVIYDKEEQEKVKGKLSASHSLVEITEDQVNHFCGNLLLVKNREGKKFWVMSEQAFLAFTDDQKSLLQADGEFIYSGLDTIESVGGGSARCMLAEIF